MNGKEAIKMLRTIQETVYLGSCKFYETIDVAIKTLEQPTIEPQRKKGTWIYLDKNKWFFHPHIVKCSVCDNTIDMYGVNAGRGDANFCPNCGAEMTEDEG